MAGSQIHGPVAPCPSLVFRDGRYWCGLVLEADGNEKERLIDTLAVGEGCCSPLNTDRNRKHHQLGEQKWSRI